MTIGRVTRASRCAACRSASPLLSTPGSRRAWQADAAELLNGTFGSDAVTDQLVVGIAKITAKAAS